MEGGVALPFATKVLVAICLISPVGFVMGMPFPTGLNLLDRVQSTSVRWAWAINAASSVLGSAAAIFLAIYFGLRFTLILGGCCYLAACLAMLASPLRSATGGFTTRSTAMHS